MTARKDPRHSHQRGVEGIVYARGVPAHKDYCVTRRSDSPVRAS
jgi:hypothetical protein